MSGFALKTENMSMIIAYLLALNLTNIVSGFNLFSRIRASVSKASRLWHSYPLSPLEEATYWVELLMEHKTLSHLKIPDAGMNLFQYLSLDVALFLLIAALSSVWVLYKLLTTALRRTLGNKKKIKTN